MRNHLKYRGAPLETDNILYSNYYAKKTMFFKRGSFALLAKS